MLSGMYLDLHAQWKIPWWPLLEPVVAQSVVTTFGLAGLGVVVKLKAR